jgi:hypothetical protein
LSLKFRKWYWKMCWQTVSRDWLGG